MNSENSKLRQQQRTDHEQQFGNESEQVQGREFSTVEDLLRYDSAENPVPPEVADRLNASLGAEPKRARLWYKALFR